MSIWVCYTETESQPSFRGYVKSKAAAIRWVKETYTHHFNDMGDCVMTEGHDVQCVSDTFAIAVEVEAME